VLPIARALRKRGFRIWLDDWCLEVGASLTRSIGEGLRTSRYGIVVLSPAFFRKRWPQEELAALLAQERLEARVVLPVWFGLCAEEVREQAPLLADRVAAKSEDGIPRIVVRLE